MSFCGIFYVHSGFEYCLLKVDLHSIRFLYVFFLHEKVRSCLSTFLYIHIRTNQTGHILDTVFQKEFFVKGYSPTLKYRCHHFYAKFLSMYTSLLSAGRTCKNADQKAYTVSWNKKRKRILCKSAFMLKVVCFCLTIYLITHV